MLIDWFTVGAQALNFLILVWLLKRFLYKPIHRAIDTREQRIAAELAAADATRIEADKARAEFLQKNEEFDRQRATLMRQATDEAKAERQRLVEDARRVADASSAKRQETLKREAHDLSQAVSHRTQEEVFAIARKALADLATTSLEESMGAAFTRRVREMDGTAKAGLGEALRAGTAPAVVRSAFDLPVQQRADIQKTLNDTFSADISVRFETASDLVSGIELTSNGQKVAWSIASYLTLLERGVDETLNAHAGLESSNEIKATPPSVPKAQ